jgi:hypothetical protein
MRRQIVAMHRLDSHASAPGHGAERNGRLEAQAALRSAERGAQIVADDVDHGQGR